MSAPLILKSYVDLLEAGEPVTVDGVCFYPLTPREPCPDALVSLIEDVEGFEVRETSQVSELEVVNPSDTHVLLLEGDIVAGGRQNRVINTTFVVQPGATVRMPTSCVERGRWGASKGNFASTGSSVSPKVRSKLKRSVTESVVMSKGSSHVSDQRKVWSETSETLTRTGSCNATDDLMVAYAKKDEELAGKVEQVTGSLKRDGLVGVAVTHADGTAAVEAFGSPRIATKVLERIVRAHLLAPTGSAEHRKIDGLLGEVTAADTTTVPGHGQVGHEVRMKQEPLNASAFVFGESTLHLSADWELAAKT